MDAKGLINVFSLFNPLDLPHTSSQITLGYDINTPRFICALLEFSPIPESLAGELWATLVMHNPSLIPLTNSPSAIYAICVEDATLHRAITRWASEYLDWLILPISMSSSTPTPVSGTGGNQQPLRELCFQRDGTRCPVTNSLDDDAAMQIVAMNAPFDGVSSILQHAYIFPLSINDKPNVHQMLLRFGNVSPANFNATAINNPSNVFLLAEEAHTYFHRFRWSIHASKEGPTTSYHLTKVSRVTGNAISILPDNKKIDFGAANPTPSSVPLPNPTLCNLHLAIARVIHASGVGEVIDRIWRREKDLKEGASWLDGSDVALGYLKRELYMLGGTDRDCEV